jgi:hypothetical protein
MTTCCEENPSGVKNTTPRGGEFTFDELSARAKDRARDWWRESSMQDDWWQQVYEDAAEIGLEITGFDTDRSLHAEGKFTKGEQTVAERIIAGHGEKFPTYQTAIEFLAEAVLMPDNFKNGDCAGDEHEYYQWQQLCEGFLKSILNNYADMLQAESEYLSSDEAAEDGINGNDYTFTEDGERC